MADDSSPKPRPFDVPTIKYLVRLMSRHDLSEIDLREGDLRIRLLRGPQGSVMLPSAPTPTIMPMSLAAPPSWEAAKPVRPLLEIKSPGPGTFYVASKPGAEPFVRVGSKLTPTSVVGVLEAMKLFTEILAECSGVIAEIVVEDKQPVEYNQVLFRVDPTG